MPMFVRKRKLNKGGSNARKVSVVGRKLRRTFNPSPSFTETFKVADINVNAGDVFRVAIDQLPQLAQYAGLYNQYKINSLKVMIYPQYNSFDGVQAAGVTGTTMPRIAYAINDTPDVAAPTTENDLLSDNGVRVRTLKDKLTIRCVPKPQRPNATLGVEVIDQKSPFFTFATAGQTNPVYSGISYWISADTLVGFTPPRFDVYYKVTFTLRDPK